MSGLFIPETAEGLVIGWHRLKMREMQALSETDPEQAAATLKRLITQMLEVSLLAE